MKTVRKVSVVALAGVILGSGLISLSGCIRYVPSRAELAESGDPSTGALGGETEFQAYESSLKDQLDKLVKERSYLLTQSAVDNAYKVGPGDVLVVDVNGFNELKGDAEITPGGTAVMPLAGEVSLGGMTLAEAREATTRAYSRFIRNPRVQLTLKNYQASRVSVMGEVAKPGTYPLKRTGQLITDLLSEAGGRTDRASGRIILLPAPKGNAAQPDSAGVEINLDQLTGRVDHRPLLVPLLPGDTIIVPEAGVYEVDGEVEKPGSFKLASHTSAMGAVASAGGFTYSADVNQVEIIRDIGDGKKALVTLDLEQVGLRGGRDVTLRDGDIVRVPSEPGRHFQRQLVDGLNGVFRGIGVNARTP